MMQSGLPPLTPLQHFLLKCYFRYGKAVKVIAILAAVIVGLGYLLFRFFALFINSILQV